MGIDGFVPPILLSEAPWQLRYDRAFLVPVDMSTGIVVPFGVARVDSLAPLISYPCEMRQLIDDRRQLYWGYYVAEPHRTMLMSQPGQQYLWPGATPDAVWMEALATFQASRREARVCEECAIDGRVQRVGIFVLVDSAGNFVAACPTCRIAF